MDGEIFKKQFLVIGKDLALRAKMEVKGIKNKEKEILNVLNHEIAVKLKNDLQEITKSMIRKFEYNLNSQISDNMKENNRLVLKEKNQLYEDLKNSIISKLQVNLNKNPDKYKEFLNKTLNNAIEIFRNEKIKIRTNKQDAIKLKDLISEFDDRFQIDNTNSIESIGGCIFSNMEENMIIDSTIENLILKKEKIIKKHFGVIFPKYIDKRETASDMIKTNKIIEKMKESLLLTEFIRENKIEDM